MLYRMLSLLIVCGIFYWTMPTVPATATGTDLLLFYSNDVHGETDPCG